MTDQEVNLRTLLELVDYRVLGGVFRDLPGNTRGQLPELLAKPGDDLEEWEAEGRGAIAGLYDLFGLMEVGILTNALPSRLPDDVYTLLCEVQKTVARRFYDLPEPSRDLMFRLWNRVTWDEPRFEPGLTEVATAKSEVFGEAMFHRFLELTVELESDPEVLALFDCLQRRGSRWSELLGAVAAARENAAVLFENEDGSVHLKDALWGLVRFVQWSQSFWELLSVAADDERVQTAMWAYHSRWYDLDLDRTRAGEEMNEAVRRMLETMESWGEPGAPEAANTLAALDRSREALFSKAQDGFRVSLSKSTQGLRAAREQG